MQAPGITVRVYREDRSVCRGRIELWAGGRLLAQHVCWENAGKLIHAGRYTECSVTKMATKGMLGIFIPDEQTGRVGVFVHEGSGPHHSAGCVVTARALVMLALMRAGMNERNITVEVA